MFVRAFSISSLINFMLKSKSTKIRYLDWNDTYLSLEPAHPSDNISGILAIGETERSSGKEILLSIVLAYEIQCRLCDIASLRSKGWDHVNYLLISSVLAISKLMNLSLEKMEESVKIVLNNLSTRQNRIGELSNWKAAAASNAVRNAVFSAKLSKAGLTGPSEIFEGKYGFQNQVSGEFNLDIEKFGMKGRDFLLPETYLKKHNAEYHAQSSIEAALELRTQLRDIDEIESLIIETHEAGFTIIGDKEKDPDKWDPKTRETADHSLPYTTVTSLIDGEITEKQYEMNKIRDINSLDLIKRVKVIENPEFTKSYPKEGIINKVTISLKNGDRLSSQIDFPKGHPMNPMVDHEVEEKFKLHLILTSSMSRFHTTPAGSAANHFYQKTFGFCSRECK